MSAFERTTIQAVIGQKLDGQFQKLLSEHERPIQQKHFALKQSCSKAEALNPDLTGKEPISDGTSEDLECVFASAKQDIEDKAETYRFAQKSRKAAQVQHGYTGSKVQGSGLQTALLMSTAVCVESLINAAFFNNAHMVASPIAAMTTSFLISLTNVVVSTSAGYFIGRNLNYGTNALDADESHVRKKRASANVLFLGFIAVMTFFHTTVGLVRTQESLEFVSHSLSNYLHMLQTPEAIFLVLIGACMSVIAYSKGVNSIDCPSPEIGHSQRAEEVAKQDLHETLDFYKGEVTAHFDAKEKAMDAPIAEQKKCIEKYNKAVTDCHADKRQLEKTIRDTELRCRGKFAEIVTAYGCISGKEQSIPVETLNRMVSFDKYLDVELPAYRSAPETNTLKSDLLLEKNQAVKRLAEIFQSAINQ